MNEYAKSFTEVNIIIKNLPEILNKKIPDKFKQMIEQEKDNEYNPNINDLVISNKVLPETKAILGLIYRDFLCSDEEKEKLQIQDKEDLQRLEEQEQSKVKMNEELFKNKEHQENKKEEIALIISEKKWYQKFVEFIKKKINFRR